MLNSEGQVTFVEVLGRTGHLYIVLRGAGNLCKCPGRDMDPSPDPAEGQRPSLSYNPKEGLSIDCIPSKMALEDFCLSPDLSKGQ